jgi:hypothetical protein
MKCCFRNWNGIVFLRSRVSRDGCLPKDSSVPAEDASVQCITAFWKRGTLSPVRFSKLLLAVTSTTVPGFGPSRDPWPYFCSFHIFTCFEKGPPLRREEGSDSYWSLSFYWAVTRLAGKLLLVLARTIIFVESPTGLTTLFYCLTSLGAFRITLANSGNIKPYHTCFISYWFIPHRKFRYSSQSESWVHCCSSEK